MNQNSQNPNKRYIGKVKNQNSKYGVFQKIYLDNPSPTNADGSVNTFHRGMLLWCDAETGKKFLVKQIKLGNYKEVTNNNVSFLTIELDDSYQVQELG